MRKILKTLATLLPLAPAAAWAGDDLVELSATNITDVLGNVRGGLKRGARLLDRADVTATFLGDDHGVPGFTIFLDGQVTDATNFSSALVGDAQTISNIDGPAGGRLVSAWVAKEFDGIGGLKAALDLQGFYGGPCRAPLPTPDGDAIEDIKEVLATAGLL